MIKKMQARLLLPLILVTLLCSGCGILRRELVVEYDLGRVPASPEALVSANSDNWPTLALADIKTPSWLDNQQMYYRLAYVNERQLRFYGTSRWTMPPAQLFEQRLIERLVQAGKVVVSVADGAARVPVLKIELDDFSQVFASPTDSVVQTSIRVSLFDGRHLLVQKSFRQQLSSPSDDATGAASTLAQASDSMISELLQWLNSQKQIPE